MAPKAHIDELPVTPTQTQLLEIHGEQLVDPYAWMDDIQSDAFEAHLRNESAFFEAQFGGPHQALAEQILTEMRARIPDEDQSAPVRWGGYEYYTRQIPDGEYDLICRRRCDRTNTRGEEEVFIDENALASGLEYFSLGQWEVSPDHRKVAYCFDTRGDQNYRITILDLRTRESYELAVRQASESMAWSADSRYLYYVVQDDANRPFEVYRHRIDFQRNDEHRENDERIYCENDDAFHVSVRQGRNLERIYIDSSSQVSSETWFVSEGHASKSGERALAIRCFLPRAANVEYVVDDDGECFYCLHNRKQENFTVDRILVRSFLEDAGDDAWSEVLASSPDRLIETFELRSRHLIIWERIDGLPRIRVRNTRNQKELQVGFDEPTFHAWPAWNPDVERSIYRFAYSSLTTPRCIYECNLDTGEKRCVKQNHVVGGYNPLDYTSERILAPTHDGKYVPISLVYRVQTGDSPGLPRSPRPLVVDAYGAYGVSNDPTFSSERLSLLDRGFIFAIAHVRGGSELGRAWYENGRRLHKSNSFRDLLSAADCLIDLGYTTRSMIAASGASAGGLVVGAMTHLAPRSFTAIVARVPFVHVIRDLLRPELPLTVVEWDEWGDPREAGDFAAMRSYCPYENVRSCELPHLLVTAARHDPCVGIWGPAKWTARLRAANTGRHVPLLYVHHESGHFGASGRFASLREEAYVCAFLLTRLQPAN